MNIQDYLMAAKIEGRTDLKVFFAGDTDWQMMEIYDQKNHGYFIRPTFTKGFILTKELYDEIVKNLEKEKEEDYWYSTLHGFDIPLSVLKTKYTREEFFNRYCNQKVEA